MISNEDVVVEINESEKKKLITAMEIERMYQEDEFIPYVVYGGLGFGKSSYAIKVLFDIYGTDNDYEEIKKRIVFKPEHFLAECKKREERGQRDRVLVWDDAGFWLYSLDYYQPLVKAITKYLSVARSHWASIIFTTPFPEWVVKRASQMPNARLVRIEKQTTIKKQTKEGEKLYKYRNAVVYRRWRTPDGKKYGVKTIYIDRFNAMLPDDFFAWYKPERDKYANEGLKLIQDELIKEKYKEKLDVVLGKKRKKEIED